MKIQRFAHINNYTFILVFSLVLNAQNIWANGAPYAPSATGGIEFKYNDKISIESETLRVSSKKINVSYVFNSTAQTAQVVDIAFPIAVDDANYSLPSNPTRPEGNVRPNLKVLVNGRPTVALPRVFLDKIDITDWLEISPNDKLPTDELKSGAQSKEFFKKHDLEYSCYNEKGDGPCHISGYIEWRYTWRQTFEPGQTSVDVSYTPEPGGDYYIGGAEDIDRTIGHGFGALSTDERNPNPTFREFFCIDDASEKAIRRMALSDTYGSSAFSIMYIWDTARYWQGPIKKFHLIIEKDFPEQIISYCPYVGAKTTPTTFEWQTENFVPQGRLKVFFYPYRD